MKTKLVAFLLTAFLFQSFAYAWGFSENPNYPAVDSVVCPEPSSIHLTQELNNDGKTVSIMFQDSRELELDPKSRANFGIMIPKSNADALGEISSVDLLASASKIILKADGSEKYHMVSCMYSFKPSAEDLGILARGVWIPLAAKVSCSPEDIPGFELTGQFKDFWESGSSQFSCPRSSLSSFEKDPINN